METCADRTKSLSINNQQSTICRKHMSGATVEICPRPASPENARERKSAENLYHNLPLISSSVKVASMQARLHLPVQIG
jgi:hypothetical protein